ncbi:hypothetical protein CH333_06255 [candidate division WOR-3 bacterium JGI_Cruoil_03_44_89]|uniref:Uncharacterized protein n=1 Tax=candidate division WOR-3 bacterium JGI_Cruoil_03_44_89 TaxID=1973748 RepID=A0A235BU17_UNCW3|nr:MAG: hypothetical protein CH333_06255 [candidate division WOR-3 bacterium JGI_Cruoil_03_44_89]
MRDPVRILLLLLSIPIVSLASIFSPMGSGEYVDFGDAGERGMGGVKIFSVPENHTFRATFLCDFLRISDGDNIRDERTFSLYGVDYFLPLPDGFGVALSLSNILSSDFYMESVGNKLGDISYERRVTGRGGIQVFSLSMYKKFPRFSLGIGGIYSFGETEEIWETNFLSSEYDDVFDTLITPSSGYGLKARFNCRYKRAVISLGYCHHLESAGLPAQFSTSFLYHMNSDWKMEGGLDVAMWKDINVSFSTSTNIGLGMCYNLGSTTVRGGLFSRSWYYKGIREMGGSVGTSVLYPDKLGELSIGLEVGRRGWEEIDEIFARLSVTLCGREIW